MLTEKLSPLRNDDGSFTAIPAIDYYNALAGMLTGRDIARKMSLVATEEGSARAEALLQEAGVDPSRPLVMLNPGASYGSSKLWGAHRYAALADALIERRSAQIIINAAPSERTVAAQVVAAMHHGPKVDLGECENSLSLLKGLMRRTSLLVTNDTGARHVAAAMGVSVVTIFGSTDPTWAQIDYDRERIVRADVSCAPCQEKRCPNPPGETFGQCMSAVTTEMVLAAGEELLDQSLVPEDGR
jgi:heptosyltransferase-2